MRLQLLLIALFFPFSAYADLVIKHIDVNQADSTLFISPSGNTLLIDSGGNGGGTYICDVAQRSGITEIDVLITTHYHSDHFGGVDELSNCGITIGQAFDRGDWPTSPAPRFQDYIDTVDHAHQPGVTVGQLIPFDPEVEVQVIAVNGITVSGQSATSDENDASVAVLVTFGDFSAFYGGDIEEHTEQRIADSDLLLNVDLYQSNHHGSNTSSSNDFLEDMHPKVIVISNGRHRGFAHPRRLILERYQELEPTPNVYQMNKFDDEECNRCLLAGNVGENFILDLVPDDGNGSIDVIVSDTGTFHVELNRVFSSISY